MPTLKQKIKFFETERGAEIEKELGSMMQDTGYNTESSYTPNTKDYPDNIISFKEKHKKYMIANPAMDPSSYMSNLRMKTRLR